MDCPQRARSAPDATNNVSEAELTEQLGAVVTRHKAGNWIFQAGFYARFIPTTRRAYAARNVNDDTARDLRCSSPLSGRRLRSALVLQLQQQREVKATDRATGSARPPD